MCFLTYVTSFWKLHSIWNQVWKAQTNELRSAQLGHQLIICILYLVLNFVFPVKTNYWKFWDKTFKLLIDGQLSSATQHQVATMWDTFFEIMASNTSNSTVPLRSRCGIWSSGYGYIHLYFDRNTPEIVFTIQGVCYREQTTTSGTPWPLMPPPLCD